jgi:hypothetical protein
MVQSGIDRVGIGGDQPAEYLGQAIRVAPDRHFPIAAAFMTTPHRITVGAGNNPVDVTAHPALRYPRPPCDLHRQLRVDRGQHIRISDQIGAIDNRLKGPIVNIAGSQQLPHPRQSQPHRPRVLQIARCQSVGDHQRRSHLRGDRLLGVGAPRLPLTDLP